MIDHHHFNYGYGDYFDDYGDDFDDDEDEDDTNFAQY